MIRLEQKQTSNTLIEVFSIHPSALRDLSLDQVQKQPVFLGNQQVELGEWFSVTGDPSDLHHQWAGDLRNVGGIGFQMDCGWIQVEGSVGNHLGSRMSGGSIQVSGDAGDFTGAEMTGGLIHLRGNSGDSPGAAYDDGQNGQNGGVILIEGSAGNSLGKAMRRGLIAVAGDVQDDCGYSMRAGTIVVLGQVGKHLGAEMIRGSLCLLQEPAERYPGFADGGWQSLTMPRLLNNYLRELGFPHSLEAARWRLLHGDLLCGGRGEVLIAAP